VVIAGHDLATHDGFTLMLAALNVGQTVALAYMASRSTRVRRGDVGGARRDSDGSSAGDDGLG
jgi:hypothetical protein